MAREHPLVVDLGRIVPEHPQVFDLDILASYLPWWLKWSISYGRAVTGKSCTLGAGQQIFQVAALIGCATRAAALVAFPENLPIGRTQFKLPS